MIHFFIEAKAMRTLGPLLALILVSFPVSSLSKDLYVDASTGDDTVSYQENSEAAPWRTLGRALWGNSSINDPNPSEAARAGDTVRVSQGDYNTTAATNSRYVPIYNPVNSGSANAPITILADGQVRLMSSNSSGTQPIIGTYNRSHVIWDGFIVDEATVPTRPDTGPVVVWESDFVTLQNLRVQGVPKTWGDNHNGIRIENSRNIAVRNCQISGFSDGHGGGITTYRAAQVLLEHNDISDANDGIFIKGLNDGPVTIRYNRVHDTKNGIMFGGIGLSGSMSYVYQNVITNSSLGAIVFIGYDSLTPAHVTVANNTIHSASPSSDGGGILLRPEYSGYRNLIFRNNIVTDSAAGVTAWGTQLDATAFSHNNYFANSRVAWIGYRDYSLGAWQSSFGKDTVGTTTLDPQFLSNGDFRLSSESPLLTTGVDFLDLDGDGSTSDPIAMGAYVTGQETIGLVDGPLGPAAPAPPRNISIE